MSLKFDIPVKPLGAGRQTNILRVDVSKSRESAWLDVTPWEPTGTGGERTVIGSGASVQLEKMPRLNRKRLEQLAAEARADYEARTGKSWELVEHVLKKYNLEIVAPEATTVPSSHTEERRDD